MNPEERARLYVQSLIARGVAAPAAAQQAGIAGASEIWGGVEPRDWPGWYLWLHRCPGVYALDLEHADSERMGDGATTRVQLGARYYPSPGERAFPSFAPEERAVFERGWIDDTGAPHVRHAAGIPRALFVVGALEFIVGGDGETFALSLAALDRARWTGPDETSCDFTGGARELAGAPLRRNVPGWDLSLRLFSALGALVAQVERRSAVRLVETVRRGFEVGGDGAVVENGSPEAALREGVLVYGGMEPPAVAALMSTVLDADARLVSDRELAPGSSDAAGASGSTVRIHPGWFARGPAPESTVGCCPSESRAALLGSQGRANLEPPPK